jgi:3-hydroxy-3-methylglutaryl CoA synthase
MNIPDGIPDDILRNILGYVGEKRCQRIDTKSARKWFPVSENVVEEVRKRRKHCALKKRLCRRRTQLVKEYETILESSDPWEAREDWERRYSDLDKDYTSFVVRRRRMMKIKKMNFKNIQEDYEDYFLG